MSERRLGEGAYATVFMAIDRFAECQVACKVIKLKKQAAIHLSSRYFETIQPASAAKATKPLSKQPTAENLWREVQLLKSISHVSPLLP